LENYYKTNFALIHYHKYSLSELEMMLPWERQIYISLLMIDIQKQKEASG